MQLSCTMRLRNYATGKQYFLKGRPRRQGKERITSATVLGKTDQRRLVTELLQMNFVSNNIFVIQNLLRDIHI